MKLFPNLKAYLVEPVAFEFNVRYRWGAGMSSELVLVVTGANLKAPFLHGSSFCNYQVAFSHVSGRPGRLITAKGTALGIPLSGIVFPRPPGHKEWPNFGHKKTAHGTGSGIARLLELSSSVKQRIIKLVKSCQPRVLRMSRLTIGCTPTRKSGAVLLALSGTNRPLLRAGEPKR